ncbi:hypothetical protein [Acetobacterium bakii]|uniref:Uncharacterized protein n=1 Tax=Acetobacterium bakii TaxID=52689 RepID=A0A0L6U3Q2_9FIRM|nr:hypothetical protein [Acetobacterium bakii]KNZ42400.1 hypothetical protein AKG39_06400 [Acetobacterium bakii]
MKSSKGRSFDQMLFNKKPKKTWGQKVADTVMESTDEEIEEAIVCEVEDDQQSDDRHLYQEKIDQAEMAEYDTPVAAVKEKEELKIQKNSEIPKENNMIQAKQKDITTLEKIITQLQTDIEEKEAENNRIKFHNSEMKEIIVSMGLTGKVELLEKLKNENNKKDFLIKQFENKLKDNNAYIENLKTNLFSGINQLFEQKPMIELQIEEINNENISKIANESEEAIENKVLNLKSEGKSPRQIASITNLTTIRIEEILKKHEKLKKYA